MALLSRSHRLAKSCYLTSIHAFTSGVHVSGLYEMYQASCHTGIPVPTGYFSEVTLWLVPSPSRVDIFTKVGEKINIIYITPTSVLLRLLSSRTQ